MPVTELALLAPIQAKTAAKLAATFRPLFITSTLALILAIARALMDSSSLPQFPITVSLALLFASLA